ncbi:hydroperoxide isomerase ALOXE3-like [Apteryx rowi]|uniref:hydroperoxide isomerase ALOXE3-like n=1 Tax=Apteryx rowi TaxID=308060 RepID=UPI000E1DBFB7|nr:hydroperoxide isomerase ALOXE3-like [Apteryx rowi]
MATYEVQVATGDVFQAGTTNSISITLVGTEGESAKTKISHTFLTNCAKSKIHCEQDLGPILLIHLYKERILFEDAWFCNNVCVTSPLGKVYRFPCYQWVEGEIPLQLREGTGKTLSDEEYGILKQHRRYELEERRAVFRWKTFAEGWPLCLDVDSVEDLSSDTKFSYIRAKNFHGIQTVQIYRMAFMGFLNKHCSWKSLEDMEKIFSKIKRRNTVPKYVASHWSKDTFFGYQFLNGTNPVVIQKCMELPDKFPVMQEMVASFLGADTNLRKEMQEGHIFIADYEILEGIPTGTINGQQQYIAAPLCLLHQDSTGLLRPIAIQLSQTPGPKSPIFLPSDHEWDWILAKTWVRNAEFYIHQIIIHLLKTHLFGEVFAISTLRHLPTCHPVFKLLIPHFRFTLHINTLARSVLINSGGIIEKGAGASYEGLLMILKRGLEKVTYVSLCLPDDIQARGVSSIPNYYYRDDGMKLWTAVASFVSGIIDFYYTSDESVQRDAELQAWVKEIFMNGFLGRESSGIPSSLWTIAELKKFLTMMIFTCSAQHAAVNTGQYDLGAFLPNYPSSMREPPPEVKGRYSLQLFLDTVPTVATTAQNATSLLLLSSTLADTRFLGQYPEEHFTEQKPKRLIRAFQERLQEITEEIEERNNPVELPYNYLNPKQIENSISI